MDMSFEKFLNEFKGQVEQETFVAEVQVAQV